MSEQPCPTCGHPCRVETVDHTPDCRWTKTTTDECEYRDTHYYCPHPEHACDCGFTKSTLYVPLDGPEVERLREKLAHVQGHAFSMEQHLNTIELALIDRSTCLAKYEKALREIASDCDRQTIPDFEQEYCSRCTALENGCSCDQLTAYTALDADAGEGA